MTMNEQEWLACVNHVAGGEYPIPRGMISNYDDWRCRSTVGRALYWMDEIEASMRVLATVLDVEPDMDDAPEMGLSEAEHKVLCLRDVADIVWKLARNEEAALTYLAQAYELSRAYKHSFRSASRGDMFYRRLAILREVGKEDQAVQEAEVMLEMEAGNEGINPYRYFAYKFLAEHQHDAGDDVQATQLYAEASNTILSAKRASATWPGPQQRKMRLHATKPTLFAALFNTNPGKNCRLLLSGATCNGGVR